MRTINNLAIAMICVGVITFLSLLFKVYFLFCYGIFAIIVLGIILLNLKSNERAKRKYRKRMYLENRIDIEDNKIDNIRSTYSTSSSTPYKSSKILEENCYRNKFVKNNILNDYTFSGKINYRLLTNTEYVFFYQLKRITDKYDLYIFPKIRLADIFRTDSLKEFGKVNSKHIDFTICDKYTKPIMFIELDDPSHFRKNNKINDMKKNSIFKAMNKELIRIDVNDINKGLYFIDKTLEPIYKNKI